MLIMEVKNKLDNPLFDGRKRAGVQARKVIEKGERFALIGGDAGTVAIRFITAGGGETFSETSAVVKLMENAAPSKAKSYGEVVATLPAPVDPVRLLETLFKNGAIDESNIRAAAGMAING